MQAFRSQRGAAFQPAVDQDRQLFRGLRLLLAVQTLPDRAGDAASVVHRRSAGGGQGSQGTGCRSFLHRRGLARSQGEGLAGGHGDGPRRQGARFETCVTLGILKDGQAEQLKEAGLDYYNHNLDTAPEFYGDVVTTHTYQDRLDTLRNVREAGLKVCSGGIVGMGESRRHRAGLIAKLANLDPPPESVPINNLVPIPGTPLANSDPIDIFEFARTIAAARITMPRSYVLVGGREQMSESEQALCFLAGS